MTKSEIVAKQIYAELIDTYIEYQRIDLETSTSNEVDRMYGGLIHYYQSCSLEDRQGIMDLIELIVVDTASTILGGLGGKTDLGNLADEFSVRYQGKEIQEDLQDDFLEIHELTNR